MDVLFEEWRQIVDGFWETIQLLVISGLIATAVGTVLAAMRVAPVRMMNAIGTSYVNIFRNTPLVVLFILVLFGLPELDIQYTYFEKSIIALSVYTAAFVCEAVRSGINTVAAGQAEAARSIGMTFTQTLGRVVLPQAFRAVVPPLASVYIALAKNTSVAAGFGITEATATLSALLNNDPQAAFALFIGIALGYVLIVAVISTGSHLLERRWAVSR
ncbi:MAG TPA: amino acid ABC transporter permease [Nocardioidaceae bacterium]|nr:amino acid ABC transporter permease [Nocardioidaceae bacterium]